MNIEHKCRIICLTNKQDPDAVSRCWHGPKPKEAGDGPVLQWMEWITTVERKREVRTPNNEDEFRRANLQRQIAESEPGRKRQPRYSCDEDPL